ncbi:monovalent cation/H+ antiporter subunit D family protein [Corynebacterium aquatimens]|uniref:Multicomponent Na+:H+ antiporter subunit D n=1 Tax=Corynebacterium aquatimens TaxID=1190508 RepID=A0A931GU99_9CORY|nr:monovalent cation/H+ antiporter subunit D family protein [Corynebacterium aquatimens]MBG6122550.1 multicomponent Na+:H+ antiporter subunit D [Corynebacterium aquatimens]WJY64910.1 Na(+)/H(+) antiporter subunit D [Corynebacterium aquatimens]
MTADVLLPVFVAIPLIASAFTVLMPWRRVNDAVGLLIPALNLIAGLWLFGQTSTHGTIGHVIGLYVGNAGIAFAADQLSAIMMVTTMLIALVANWFAIASGETRSSFYIPLSLVLITGVSGALLTADLFNFFVMIEVMLLPSYGLIAMTGTRYRLASARLFVLFNLAASTLLVLGVGYVYGVTGAVNIAALRGVASDGGPATVAMGIIMIAICAKAAIFPLHTWLPRTYTSTSAAVMALFSGLHTKVAVYMIFRLWVVVFGIDVTHGSAENWIIIAVMVASMLVGSFAGLGESTIRQVLAYQMVAGMPFILVMLAFTDIEPRYALAAGLLYTIHHMVTMGSLILNSGAIEETYGTATLSKLSGLARRDPLTSAVFAAGAFSLIGFPPFSGLWGKLTIVFAAAAARDARSWVVLTAIVLGSIGALLSMFRIWKEVFWGAPMKKFDSRLTIRLTHMLPSLSLALVSMAMFIGAGPVWEAVTGSVDALLDVDAYTSAVLGDSPVGVPR